MFALLIEYDGTSYAGWQLQPNVLSVQEVVERTLQRVYGAQIELFASGRTDAGVHARGQVAHYNPGVDAHDVPFSKIVGALNAYLPPDIRIRAVQKVEPPFHARFSAIWREYVYRIAHEPSVFGRLHQWYPDVAYDASLLEGAAKVFLGKHDFTTFSKHNPSTPKYVCNVHDCRVEHLSDHILVTIRADRFVYGMCRAIVGAMMAVARGKMDVSDIAPALVATDRKLQAILVPAHGLTLNRIGYHNHLFNDL